MLKLHYGDLTDSTNIISIIKEVQPDEIYNLAAMSHVHISFQIPEYTANADGIGTLRILEAVRLYGKKIKSIIVASSDKAYGEYKKQFMPYKEEYKLIPKYPYDVSKACADMISISYSSDLYKIPIIVTRFCNIFSLSFSS